MCDPGKLSMIHESFISSLRVRYLGDNLVLLISEEGEDLNRLFKGAEEWLSGWFESLQPLHIWSVDCFTKVLATLAQECLRSWNMQTSTLEHINKIVRIKINGFIG